MANYTYNVSSYSYYGNLSYSFSGGASGNNPDLNVNVSSGDTLTFNMSAPGHPFYIKTSLGSGSSGAYSTGVSGNGTASGGSVVLTVSDSTPSTLYYQCGNHYSMNGQINLTITTTSTSTTSTSTTSTSTTSTSTTSTSTTSTSTTSTSTTSTSTTSTTTTTTTTTTAAPDTTTTTTSTTTAAPDETITTTTTTTEAPTTGWTIQARRLGTAKEQGTFFSFTPPTDQKDLSIVDVELEVQKVPDTVSASSNWQLQSVETKTGNIPVPNADYPNVPSPNPYEITNIDTSNLNEGMIVNGSNIPNGATITFIDTNNSSIIISDPVTTGVGLVDNIEFSNYVYKKVEFEDLPLVDFTSPDILPETCSTELAVDIFKPGNVNVVVRDNISNPNPNVMKLSVMKGHIYNEEVNWSVSLRQRVIRLLSVPGFNEGGEREGTLVDVPTSQTWSHQVYMGHDLCDGDSYDNDKPASDGFLDIPPAQFEGGEMNATSSWATMSKTNPYSSDPPNINGVPIISTLSLMGGGDKEVTAVVTVRLGVDCEMFWKVPKDRKFKIEHSREYSFYRFSNSTTEYELYGYSLEVKGVTDIYGRGAGEWRQFAEYTDDTPAPTGCEGTKNSMFTGFSASFGGDDDRGPNQTVIRGNSGRIYGPEETLFVAFQNILDVIPTSTDPNLPKHVLEGVGPVEKYHEFDRSPDYKFRIRTIYKAEKEITFTDGAGNSIGPPIKHNSILYTNPISETTDYWVEAPYDYLGGLYRARNVDFGSEPLEVEGVTYDAFTEDNVPAIPDPPEFPME